jgi:pyrroloquinoline-quinone synthase
VSNVSGLEARLREVGARRYHDRHPLHVRMHDGALQPAELRAWVLNRWCYQARVPIKDALVLAKSSDPVFRRVWIERIRDQDGPGGGLDRWLSLARGVGLDPFVVASERDALPAARAAADAYVSFVREASLLEAVAASLTELFAPPLHERRAAAWERHYPWIEPASLAYFRGRSVEARRDAEFALAYVIAHARTPVDEDACVSALVHKCEILWAICDAIEAGP